MICWKCKAGVDSNLKISFRSTCPHCGIDLHSCAGCRYYSIGKPNDCLIPGTEFVRDREAANFCEDFKLRIDSDEKGSEGKKKFDSLFKKEEP